MEGTIQHEPKSVWNSECSVKTSHSPTNDYQQPQQQSSCRYVRTITLSGNIEETPISPVETQQPYIGCIREVPSYKKARQQQPYQTSNNQSSKQLPRYNSPIIGSTNCGTYPTYTNNSESNCLTSAQDYQTQTVSLQTSVQQPYSPLNRYNQNRYQILSIDTHLSPSSHTYSPQVELISPVSQADSFTTLYPDSPNSIGYGIEDNVDVKPSISNIYAVLENLPMPSVSGAQNTTAVSETSQQMTPSYTYPRVHQVSNYTTMSQAQTNCEVDSTLTSISLDYQQPSSLQSQTSCQISTLAYQPYTNNSTIYNNNYNNNNNNNNQQYWATASSFDCAGTTITSSCNTPNIAFSYPPSGSSPTSSLLMTRPPNQAEVCIHCGMNKTPLWQRDSSVVFICMYCKDKCNIKKMNEEKVGSKNSSEETEHKKSTTNKCMNCGTNTTTLWRRNSKGEHVCNACGLYHKLRGVNRPISMSNKGIAKRKRKPKCQTICEVTNAIKQEVVVSAGIY